MGSEHSKRKRREETLKYGQIFIKTDKTSYFGGETVSGHIYLNLLMPYPGRQLFLKFKGQENVDYLETTSSYNGQTTTTTTHHGHKDNNIIKTISLIYAWDTLLPGQYTFPFAVVIPQGLPNSFHHEARSLIANISYRLEAFIQPDNPKTDYKLAYDHGIVIQAPIRNDIQGSDKQITNVIKKCGLIKKGSNVLTAHLDKNWYCPGETANIRVQLDNSQCRLRNKNISIKLKQYVTVQEGYRKSTKKYTKVATELNGVEPGHSGNLNISLRIPQIQYKNYRKLQEANINKCLSRAKEDKNVMGSTTNGNIIQSEFLLEISCEMKGLNSTQPKLSFPVQICYPDSQPRMFTQAQIDSRQGFDNVGVNAYDMNMQQKVMNYGVPNGSYF